MQKLEPAQIEAALSQLPGWAQHEQEIHKTFAFADFVAAIRFVNQLAELAEDAEHHPDIDIRYNKVTLALSTHDAGGLTEKDVLLAEQIENVAASDFKAD